MEKIAALRRMQFVTVPPFASIRTFPPVLSRRPPMRPRSAVRPERTAPALSRTKTRWASTDGEAVASSVSGPAVLRTTTSAGSPVSPTTATALVTATASATLYVPASTRTVSPSCAASTPRAMVRNAVSRVVPALESLPAVETYQSAAGAAAAAARATVASRFLAAFMGGSSWYRVGRSDGDANHTSTPPVPDETTQPCSSGLHGGIPPVRGGTGSRMAREPFANRKRMWKS